MLHLISPSRAGRTPESGSGERTDGRAAIHPPLYHRSLILNRPNLESQWLPPYHNPKVSNKTLPEHREPSKHSQRAATYLPASPGLHAPLCRIHCAHERQNPWPTSQFFFFFLSSLSPPFPDEITKESKDLAVCEWAWVASWPAGPQYSTLHLGAVPSSEKPGSPYPELLRGQRLYITVHRLAAGQADRRWCEQELPA